MTDSDTTILPVEGLRLGTAAAGIKYADRDDLLVIEIPEGAACAGVFTRNAFCAAPVQVAREHLRRTTPRYLLVNSGNANAGTGNQGMKDAQRCCQALAELTGCTPEQVLPFSTGVIGEVLPVERMLQALPTALERLDSADWQAAAAAIMTTDTVPKLLSRTFELGGSPITVTGIAKGSGMIRPDMATMLAYIATDATVSQPLLQNCLEHAVAPSFNSITVDGDTSTNDACMLIASGASSAAPVTEEQSEEYRELAATVEEVCRGLARAIVKDGEGATKLVTVEVITAKSPEEAREVAFTVAHSPLVKTALFASDPNWGRILAAVGRAGIRDLDISGVGIWLDEVCIVSDGGVESAYTEEAGQRVMDREEMTIRIGLGRGEAGAQVLTCDLSYDYVRINAEYRT
jgi:glutamate N-acetyltransferase/amino-acid N-acetyltransferase